ncbi:MAG: CpXC domain-containing protein [Kiritimatiellae bacterium]|nr:CpXC domain-containing protein [Kiritimatiellia bacterium]
MSEKQSYQITCPRCAHVQDVELYDAINVSETPRLKRDLMADQLNAVICAQCEFRFRVDKALLYSDPKRHIVIHLIPLNGKTVEEGEQEFRRSLETLNGVLPAGFEAPRVHLVFTRAELVERIFLLEAKLNERVIEYIKFMIYTRNMDKVAAARKALLFDAEDSTAELLCFLVQDVETQKLEGMLQYNREAYDALSAMFDRDDQTPNLLEMFPGPYISARALLMKESAAL